MKEFNLRISDVSKATQKEPTKNIKFWSDKAAARSMDKIQEQLAVPITVEVIMLPTESPANAIKKIQVSIQEVDGSDSCSKTIYGLNLIDVFGKIKL